jgi:alpha-tubulin suppressor-like RCC1 family protein
VSWLGAGSYHSLALNIEGYGYVWGRNDRGQLGLGHSVPIKSDTKQPCPRIVEQVLGVGIAQACCNYNQTFICCADKLKTKPDSDVFNVWKAKLKKHEERA